MNQNQELLYLAISPDLPVKLLLDPRYPTGIRARSGFKSLSIFYAAFKEEYNMTPTAWMKKNL